MLERPFLVGAILVAATVSGCQKPQAVDVDLSTKPARFLINHHGWPRPFWVPRVTEFAIATEQESIWQLESTSERGTSARELAIVYGEVPDGFRQVFPEDNDKPKELQQHLTYFVAAGGKKALYRIVFSLPVEPLELHYPPPPASQPNEDSHVNEPAPR